MLELVIGFISGSLLTVVLLVVGVLSWIYSQPRVVSKDDNSDGELYIRPELPERLKNLLTERSEDGSLRVPEETCHWFNLIVAFVFNELRDSTVIKRLVMKRINKEFEEVMFTKAEGKMIQQLTVRDYFLGKSMPVIQSATLVRVEDAAEENQEIQEMDIILCVEYTGQFKLAIDVDLILDTAAYVAVEVSKLEGKGRLRFSRKQSAQWSFSFIEDPLLELKVNSHFEGRQFLQLSSIIEKQLRKWVKRRHTLPAYKMRYKPFFRKAKPQSQLLDVYVHDEKLTVGKLSVSVLECSRLCEVDGASSVYCTVSIAPQPWQPLVHLWRTQWPVHEFIVQREAEQESIGILYRLVPYEEGSDRCDLIIISEVFSPSAAYNEGVKKGDVLTRVDNVKVTSVKQAKRLMKKFKDGKTILITVKRPPAQFTSQLLKTVSCSPMGVRTNTPDGGVPQPEASVPAISVPSTTAMDTATDPLYHPLRQRSYTAAQSDFKVHESIRNSRTPISSEDERDPTLSKSKTVRKRSSKPVESDTVSLYGVSGETGGDEEEGKGSEGPRSGEDDSYPQLLTQSYRPTSKNTSKKHATRRLSPSASFSSSHSSPSPQVPPVSPQPPPPSPPPDSVDAGASSVGRIEESQVPRNEILEQKQTRGVRACKNPAWNQKFRFDVGENHHYLNICIWERLREERGDLLMGHVTIHLMDIAMECFHTTSGTHQQRYVLVAAQPARPSTSRAAVQATTASSNISKKKTSKKGTRDWAGDILLKFRHSPKIAEKKTDSVNTTPETQEQSVIHQTIEPGPGDNNHKFIAAEPTGIAIDCDICRKMIWTLKLSRVYQCENCGLKCHKKCVDYCMKEIRCHRKKESSPSGNVESSEKSFNNSEYYDEESASHRLLEQNQLEKRSTFQHSDSFEMLNSPKEDDNPNYPETADEPVLIEGVDLRGGQEWRTGTEHGYSIGMEQHDGEEWAQVYEQHDEIDRDSDFDRLLTPYPDSDIEPIDSNDDLKPQQMDCSEPQIHKETQLRWSANIPPDERESALNKRISDLQVEINRIDELMSNVYAALQAAPKIPNSQREGLEIEIERYEEKLEPLKLLMNEMMVELAVCTGVTFN